MIRVRRWWFRHVVRYKGETCDCCGRRYPAFSWRADPTLWNRVVPIRHHLLCPRCFTRFGAKEGEMVCWLALPLDQWTELGWPDPYGSTV